MKNWNFSLEIYRLPGIADRLIALQDDHGADVNLVLSGVGVDTEGRMHSTRPSSSRPMFSERPGGGGHRSSTQSAARYEGRQRGISPETSEPIGEVKRLELDAERVMQSAGDVSTFCCEAWWPAYVREALEVYLRHSGIAVTGDVSKLVDCLPWA